MTEVNLMQRYLQLVHSENTDERAEAARELKVFLRHDSASKALVELLGDSDWRVRRASVESFLEMRAHNAIPQILQALYDEENAGRRNAAIDILTRFGKEIIPYLQPHFSSENADVHMFLINILGDLRDDAFIDYINLALDHKDANIVSAAILTLGRIGHPESLPHLLRFLRGDQMWFTFQAIEAAGEMQDPAMIADLIRLHESQYYRKAVIKALSKFQHPDAYHALAKFLVVEGRVEPDALQALIDLYHAPEPAELKTEEQRLLRAECKKSLNSEGIQVLIREYESAQTSMKKNIMEILSWTQAKDALPMFMAALQDPELLDFAAQALIYCDKYAAASLISRLDEDLMDDELIIVLNILNEMAGVSEIPEVKKFLDHDSPDIRYFAYKLLARSIAPEITELLIHGAMDTHPPVNEVCRDPLLARCRNSKIVRNEVLETMRQKVHSESAVERANAIEFITLLEGEQSFPLLFQALKDEEAIVRQKTVSLMGTGYHDQFQRPLIAALADEDARVRELAARALGSYSSPEVVDALMAGVRDEVIWVRMATYESLAAIANERSAEAFLQQLESENPIARAVLLKGLGRFRIPASKEILLKYLSSDDPEIRKSACESLGIFNDNDIVFHLFTLLQNDPDWRVRVSAIRALTNIKPFRLQEALLERLRADEDPFVRKEILTSLLKLGIDYLPQEVYGFLLDRNLADITYEFLLSTKQRFAKQIQEVYKSQPPAIRRILKTIIP